MCIISVNSVNKEGEPNGQNSTDNDNDIYNSPDLKKDKNGLSGGEIAAIVICSVLVLAIIAAIIIYSRSKTVNPTPPMEQAIKGSTNTSSTLNQLHYEHKQSEF